MSTPQLITAITSIIALVAAAIAVYVGLSLKNVVSGVKAEMSEFKLEFMRELDERYVRSQEAAKEINSHNREEERYREMANKADSASRADLKDKIEGIDVHLFKVNDELSNLKDIVAIIKIRGDMLDNQKLRRKP